jgi:hypothetical protein
VLYSNILTFILYVYFFLFLSRYLSYCMFPVTTLVGACMVGTVMTTLKNNLSNIQQGLANMFIVVNFSGRFVREKNGGKQNLASLTILIKTLVAAIGL